MTLGALAVTGCVGEDSPDDELILDPDGKEDIPGRAKLFGEIESGARAGVFEIGPREHKAFFFSARAGATFDLEIMRSGTSIGFDTTLTIYGPRTEAMQFGRSLASDDDSGYGKLSKITGFVAEREGVYAAVVAGQATTREGFFITLGCKGNDECTPPDYVDLQSIGKTTSLSGAIASKCTTDTTCPFDATTVLVYGASTRAGRLAAWADDRWQNGRGYQSYTPLPGELTAIQIDTKVAARLGLSGTQLRTAIGATAATKVHVVDVTRGDVDMKLYVFETPDGAEDFDLVIVTLPDAG